MQYIYRYNVKPMLSGAFQQWLAENEAKFIENSPKGWHYLGTWFTVMGFGKFDCETRWEVDDYEYLGDSFGNETFQKLNLTLFTEYFDTSKDGETYLMKSTSQVKIMEGT